MRLSKIQLRRLGLFYYLCCVTGVYGAWGYLMSNYGDDLLLRTVFLLLIFCPTTIGGHFIWRQLSVEYVIQCSLRYGAICRDLWRDARAATSFIPNCVIAGVILWAIMFTGIASGVVEIFLAMACSVLTVCAVLMVVIASILVLVWGYQRRRQSDTCIVYRCDYISGADKVIVVHPGFKIHISTGAPELEYRTVAEVYAELKR